MTESDRVISYGARLALYGEVGPNLARLTADYRHDHLVLQFVVLDKADDDEIDDYSAVAGEILSHLSTASLDEQYVRVGKLTAVAEVPALPILLFCRNLRGM